MAIIKSKGSIGDYICICIIVFIVIIYVLCISGSHILEIQWRGDVYEGNAYE